MRVCEIKIKNILGLEEVEIKPGRVTRIEGGNGAGKTSVLEAIKSALGGGVHDATLLKAGEFAGEIVLGLDDGSEYRKTVAEKTNFSARDAHGPLGSPAGRIKAIVDSVGCNPVAFMLAPPKERAKMLLETMPLDVDPERLRKIAGDVAEPDMRAGGLQAIDTLRKSIFAERTAVNRLAKEKSATAGQLADSLPEEAPGRTVTQIRSELDASSASEAEAVSAAKSGFDAELAKFREERARIDRQIAAAEERQRAIVAETRATFDVARSHLNGELNLAIEREKAAARAAQTRETAEKMAEEAEQLEAQSSDLGFSLECIDEYKAELLASLPIPGLEIEDGEILSGGIPFDRLNTAEQIKLAVRVAMLRAKHLRLMLVDGAERFDAETLDALCREVEQQGIQLIISRVTSGPLQITTDEGV